MRYASVCSGVEAASLAWGKLGWTPVFFAEVEPFPCAVLQQRFNATKPLRPLDPEEAVDEKDRKMRESWMKQINKLPEGGSIPNLGDFTKIKGEDYVGAIDLLVGGTPCFPAGNMVLTEFGYRPIEQIKVGEFVMSHKGRLCRVLNTGSKIADNVGECKVMGRPPFKVTANHPFLVAHGKRVNSRKAPDYGRVRISDADFERIDNSVNGFGCFLNVKEHPCSVSVPQFPPVYSASRLDIMKLCGWYIGDGYIRFFKGKKKKSVILCLSEKKFGCFDGTFNGYINYSWSVDKNNVYKVTISCTALADFLLTWFGYHADGKRIPAWVYGLEKKERDALLLGYTMTDGCVRHKEARYTTVSKSLAYGVADLISFSSVYYSEVKQKKEIEGRIVNQRPFYECRGILSETTKHFRYDRYLCCRIHSFEIQNNLETVYNIEVENDHSYIVNGLCVHNCQDLSVAGKRAGFEGARSSLALDFVRLAYEARCKFFVWENVPGVFSSNRGRDFATLLSMFCGYRIEPPKPGWRSTGIVQNRRPDRYGLAWRVLDAQFTRVPGFPFAVPQRRRRVFLVGCLGDWERAASVLLEPDRLQWDTPPRIKTRETFAGGAGDCTETASGGGYNLNRERAS